MRPMNLFSLCIRLSFKLLLKLLRLSFSTSPRLARNFFSSVCVFTLFPLTVTYSSTFCPTTHNPFSASRSRTTAVFRNNNNSLQFDYSVVNICALSVRLFQEDFTCNESSKIMVCTATLRPSLAFPCAWIELTEHLPLKYFRQQDSLSILFNTTAAFSIGFATNSVRSFYSFGASIFLSCFLRGLHFFFFSGRNFRIYFALNQSSLGSQSLPTDSTSSSSAPISGNSSCIYQGLFQRRVLKCVLFISANTRRMDYPISLQSSGKYCLILWLSLLSQPQKELSTVQTRGIPSISQTTFLAVWSLPPLNLQEEKSNRSSDLATRNGRIFAPSRLPFWELPQKNVPNLREWECKSRSISTFCPSFSMALRRAWITGWNVGEGSTHFLFGSHPDRSARVLPCTTPSTLIMGTILKMKLASKFATPSLAESKNRKTPSIMNPEVTSPECCLPMTHTTFLLFLTILLVISNKSTQFPPSVTPRFLITTQLCLVLSERVLVKKLLRSVSLQGMAQLKQTMSPSCMNLYSNDRQWQGSSDNYLFKCWLQEYETLEPQCTHPIFRLSKRRTENTAGFIPYEKSDIFLHMLTRLNRTVEPIGTFRMLKKNH